MDKDNATKWHRAFRGYCERLDAVTAMNRFVKALNNENAYYNEWIWLVPDEATADDLEDIAKDIDTFNEVTQQFIFIMRRYLKDGLIFSHACITEDTVSELWRG